MEENIIDILHTDLWDGGKKTISFLAKKKIDKKCLEDIFVQAGKAVSNYEKEQTEENELRAIAFCEENMKAFANVMQKINEFQWETVLETYLDDLLNQNSMSRANRARCKEHFMAIVRNDMEMCFAQIMERNYGREVRDNTVAIMGQLERQERSAQEILYYIKNQNEKDAQEKKNRERQEKSERPGYTFAKDNTSGCLKQADWSIKSRHIKGWFASAEEQRQEIIMLTQAWKAERTQYPGWYIVPCEVRRKLSWNTEGSEFLSKKDLVPFSMQLEFCYEYVWRCERGMFLYNMWEQKSIRNIWDEYKRTLQGNGLGKTAKEGELSEKVLTEEFEEHWFFIGQTLLREYREDGAMEEWQSVYRTLRQYAGEGSSRAEELHMETVKYEFSRMNIGKVIREIRKWSIPREQYSLRLQVIGILAECGETADAVQRMHELKQEIAQEMQEEHEDTYHLFLRSLHAGALQLESLLMQAYAYETGQYEQCQENINRIIEQSEAEREYFDWKEILSVTKEELLKSYTEQYEVKNPFELNRETVTIFGGNASGEESYYLYRVLDALALPLEIGRVTLMSSLELPWMSELLRINISLANFMLIRGSKSENFEKLINRRFLTTVSEETAVNQVRFMMIALDENLEELTDRKLCSVSHIHNVIQRNVPEMLCRYVSRAPEHVQKEVLFLLKRMMEKDGLLLNQRMNAFVTGVLGQVSERVKAEMVGTLIDSRICEHPSLHEKMPSADIFSYYFSKTDYDAVKKYCRVEKRQIEELFAREETSLYVWRTKVVRLSTLYELGLLDEEQKKRLARLIWSRINENTRMPDLPYHYLWFYMTLPHEEVNAPAVSIKAYLLESGLMKTLGGEEGCKATLGRIRYLDELRTMALNMEKDFWSIEEAEQIFLDAVGYWQILKKKLTENHSSFLEWEFRIRARKIVSTLAEVYKSVTGEVSKSVKDSVCLMITEMDADGIGTLQLEVLFGENVEAVTKRIRERMYTSDEEAAIDALSAAYTGILKYPKEQVAISMLEEMQQILRTRKQPGLISAIYLLHNLLYCGCEAMTDEVVKHIDRSMVELEKATRYENYAESDKAVKEAVAIRKASMALAFQMYRRMKGEAGEGARLWKSALEREEFAEVRNEWYSVRRPTSTHDG